MELFESAPFGREEVHICSALHFVLCAHSEYGSYPASDVGENDVAEYGAYEHAGSLCEGESRGFASCDVDYEFAAPDEGEVEEYYEDAYDGVE